MHLLAWTHKLTGIDEYDNHLQALQPVIRYKHFKSGIKHLSQWSGHEDQELQHVHVTITTGCPQFNSRIAQNQCAFHDFLYLVQYQSHSEGTLDYMNKALHNFHSTKDEYIKAGVRQGRRTTSGKICLSLEVFIDLTSGNLKFPFRWWPLKPLLTRLLGLCRSI